MQASEFFVDKEIENIILKIQEANSYLKDAAAKAENLEKRLEGTEEWNAASKNKTIELLQIIKTFHKELIKADDKQCEALMHLMENSDNFMNNNSIVQTWKYMD